MRSVRRRLAPVFGAWLLCQVCSLALVPIATAVALGLSDDEPACTCNHPGATECPMHHHRPAGPSKTDCHCDGNSSHDPAVLASIFVPPALVTWPSAIDVLEHAVPSAAALTAPPAFVPASPDSPPPRA